MSTQDEFNKKKAELALAVSNARAEFQKIAKEYEIYRMGYEVGKLHLQQALMDYEDFVARVLAPPSTK